MYHLPRFLIPDGHDEHASLERSFSLRKLEADLTTTTSAATTATTFRLLTPSSTAATAAKASQASTDLSSKKFQFNVHNPNSFYLKTLSSKPMYTTDNGSKL